MGWIDQVLAYRRELATLVDRIRSLEDEARGLDGRLKRGRPLWRRRAYSKIVLTRYRSRREAVDVEYQAALERLRLLAERPPPTYREWRARFASDVSEAWLRRQLGRLGVPS